MYNEKSYMFRVEMINERLLGNISLSASFGLDDGVRLEGCGVGSGRKKYVFNTYRADIDEFRTSPEYSYHLAKSDSYT